MVIDCDCAVQRLVRWLANPPEYQQHLLMYLFGLVSYHYLKSITRCLTHEPSETEMTRGASNEEGLIDIWEEPLDVVDATMPWQVLVMCHCVKDT